MTAREVYQKLRESKTGESKLAKLRAWLRGNRDASGQEMMTHAVACNLPEGTMTKIRNLLAGLPVDGIAKSPDSWDTDLDGPYTPPVPIHQTELPQPAFAGSRDPGKKAEGMDVKHEKREHPPTTQQQPSTIRSEPAKK